MMFKILVLSIAIGLHTVACAQLRNPSFELTDSTGMLANWKIQQGKLTKLSAIQFGAIPFTAFEGNYFALLQSDTSWPVVKAGIIEQQFVFADTPKSISINNLYLPENTSQHARLQLVFTKWNGSSRDTVLFLSDTLPVIADGNTIPIQWNAFNRTLSSLYRNASLPDSAWIRITNDDTQTGKTVRLYLDHIRWSKWPVGLNEKQSLRFNVYPNPAHTQLTVQFSSIPEHCTLRLIRLSGQQVASFTIEQPLHTYEWNTAEISSGLYILQLISGLTVSQQLITIQH
jgi:hypothetical protein